VALLPARRPEGRRQRRGAAGIPRSAPRYQQASTQQDLPASQLNPPPASTQQPVHSPGTQLAYPEAEQVDSGAVTQHQPLSPQSRWPSPVAAGSKPAGQMSQRYWVHRTPLASAHAALGSVPPVPPVPPVPLDTQLRSNTHGPQHPSTTEGR
jgi:hypothetical protein